MRRVPHIVSVSLVLASLVTATEIATAGPTRVEGLVGDPTGSLESGSDNGLLVRDEMNIFQNPALQHRYRGEVLLDMGIGTGGSGTYLEPMGGVLFGPGEVVTLSLFLNRQPGRYSDQGPLLANLLELTSEAYGASLELSPSEESGGGRRFLPIDLMASAAVGRTRFGLSFYGAFDRSSELDQQDDRSTRLVTSASYLEAALGLQIEGERLSPEVWIRGSTASNWRSSLSWEGSSADEPTDEEPALSGIRNTFGATAGVRLPARRQQVVVMPALVVGYSQGQRCSPCSADDPDALGRPIRRLAALVGAGLEYEPSPRFLLVATASVEIGGRLVGGVDEDSRHASFGARPVLSIGAETTLLDHLKLRGSVRAAVGSSLLVDLDETYDDDGHTDRSEFSVDGQGPRSAISAAAGLAFPFEHVVIDLTVGGQFLQSEAGSAFFSRLGLTFFIPNPTGDDDANQPEPGAGSTARHPDLDPARLSDADWQRR